MGIFSKNQNIVVKISMDFQINTGIGQAVIEFESIKPIQNVSEVILYYSLASLFYGRILYAHKESRTELFNRIDKIADKMIEEVEEIDFENWEININNNELFIWPWEINSSTYLKKPKVYSAILEGSSIDELSLRMKMAFGLEKILAPSSVLILIYSLSKMLDKTGVKALGLFLKGMNNYYRDSDKSLRPSSERKALESVFQTLLNE